ncbi:ribonuclease H-like domain-containing protein [Tanacetum coccineum]
MTNDNPPPTPALTLSDKLMAMNHLTTFVPEKLDVDAMNYSSWVYYFFHLCHGYRILDHLVDPVASSSTTTPTDPPPQYLVDLNPTTAKDAWTYIEAIFQDNKCLRAMALKAELRNLKLGDLSIDGYFQKIESIVLVLNGLGSPLRNDDVVTFELEGLPSTYETISTVIVSREPFPDLKMGVQYSTGSPQQGVHYPQHGVHLVPGTSQPPIQFTTGVQQQQGGSFPGSVHLGQSPSMPFYPSQLFASGSQGLGQATLLSNAFNTTTLQEPASVIILNTVHLPVCCIGDRRFIPVTNSGHSVLSTSFRPLCLNNVLITPNIVKNLISVRQFVRDNSCTVEFDPFGFSVKDFITRRVLLRCDSTGELYPVTKPSTIPHAFLTSQYMWHQRIGHLRSEVLRRLVSSDSISCNKEKLPVLCHACQLGKHVKLPFVSSSSSVTSCFDIVYSDLWTSPIPSLSVDHGGEFDNHAFHKLFNDNGIQFRFSCTRTSHIRTLLFQAHLPPNYWTEALNMAVYLLNILPSRAINNEIPFTRLFGAQPDYSVLRVFGCLCYPHIDTNHKLGPRATPSIFLGHAANHFGYRCLDLNTNKIIISRHVTFDETVFPFPSTKSTTTPSYDFLDDSTDLISTIIRTAPITLVLAPVHTSLVDVPTPPTQPTPPTPPPPPTPYTQVEGVDVDETFCLVVKPGTIWTILSLAISRHWHVHQLDVKNAFLHGDLAETGDDTAFLLLYVDDIRKYAMEILEHAHMVGCNSSQTHVDTESKLGDGGTPVVDPTLYQSLAGSLQYLTFTRPDITYVVQQVCLYMHDPREPLVAAAKRVAEKMETELGDLGGYAIRFEDVTGHSTKT